MNFGQLQDWNQKPKVEPYPWMENKTFTLVQDLDHLTEVVDKAIEANLCALDLETEGLDNRIDQNGRTKHNIVGYCLSFDGEEGFYVPVGHKIVNKNGDGIPHPANIRRLDAGKEIKRLCENCVTIYHNACFDHEFLFGSGEKTSVEFDSIDMFEDTLILDYLRDSTDKRHGLKHLSERFLGMEMIDLKQLFLDSIKDRDFSTLDPTDRNTLLYAGSDGICTYLLYKYYCEHGYDHSNPDMPFPVPNPQATPKETIVGEQEAVYRIEKALVPALRWMERNRPKVDRKYTQSLITEVESMIEGSIKEIEDSLVEGIRQANSQDRLYRDIHELRANYDVTSPQQLGEALTQLKATNPSFSNVELEVTEKSGQVKTDAASIEKLTEAYGDRFPFLAKIKKFRILQKALGTYIKPIHENSDDEDHTIRFRFLPNRVDTGRFAASKGQADQGYSGINVQSTPACYNSAKLKVKKIHSRPQGMGDNDASLVDSYLNAVEQTDFLKYVKDGHFITENRTGQEFCIRKSCDGCPFEAECKREEPVKKKFYSVEAAVRPALVAREGHVLVAIDYSGLELRVAANLSKEPAWIKEFNEGDGDLHALTARLIYGDDIMDLPASEFKLLRQNAKGVNFSVIYGGGGNAIARASGVDVNEGWEYLNKMMSGLPVFASWTKKIISDAHKNREVTTAIGRRIRLAEINSSEKWIRAKQERNSVNGIVQGTATGDLIKYAMGAVYRTLKERGQLDVCRMMLTIHDELVFEIRQDKLDELLPVIDICMTEFADKMKWPVKLDTDVEFGRDWSVRHDWGAIHSIDPETGLAKAETPRYLVPSIKMFTGMWYKDDEGNKAIWDGQAFVNEKNYEKEEVTMNLQSEDPTKGAEGVESRDDDTEDDEDSSKKEKETKRDLLNLPVYTYKIRVPLNGEDNALSYTLRVRRIKDISMALAKTGRVKPTHLLCIEDTQGKKLILPEDRITIDPKIFEMFALYEGI